MKEKISLWQIGNMAVKDMNQLLGLGLIVVLTTAIILVCIMSVYVLYYGPIESLFLCEIVGVMSWILMMNYMFLVEFKFNFMTLCVGLSMLLFTPIQVRMFKEFE